MTGSNNDRGLMAPAVDGSALVGEPGRTEGMTVARATCRTCGYHQTRDVSADGVASPVYADTCWWIRPHLCADERREGDCGPEGTLWEKKRENT